MSVKVNKIAALCVDRRSSYHDLGLDCYDIKRDVRTFIGNQPVIAHPPCRGWSLRMRHFAKPPPGEKDLALFCAEKVAVNGGVLEHPAFSLFVKEFINAPGWKVEEVHQAWFGYAIQKRTWLLMPSGYRLPEIPFKLLPKQKPGDQGKWFANATQRQRSHTTIDFARWMIELVRLNAKV